MNLTELARHWEAFGEQDPLWAVLSAPGTTSGRWDIEDFFASGERYVRSLFDQMRALGLAVPSGRALDFGCGVGRLTRALTAYFDECVGVDVAESMIDRARGFDEAGDCRFIVNRSSDLALFDSNSFHFVGSFLVLQHMSEELAKRYIAEFVRVLLPGGLGAFQIPSAPRALVRSCPLPLEARTADLRFAQASGDPVAAGATFILDVEVRNASRLGWAANPTNPVNLGNHWRDASGEIVAWDDGRAAVPALAAGDAVGLQLLCTAPAIPGLYQLEVDLVQECVSWFRPDGSPVRLAVRVAPAPEVTVAAGVEAAERRPKMEMHGVPLAEVVEVLELHGGTLHAVLNDGSAGDFWSSYTYLFSKES